MNLRSVKQVVARVMPARWMACFRRNNERRKLNAIPQIQCVVDNLRRKQDLSLGDILASDKTLVMWNNCKKEIDRFAIPDGTGGVNPGDRRAVFSLISALTPSSVLEIGTHIGGSTLPIASALYRTRIKNGSPARLTTLDIRDVNSPTEQPWRAYGISQSPREMIRLLNYESFVEFVTDTSTHYFSKCQEKFDFIFLDGDHAAPTVYQEIPAALKRLSQDGVILLHDYFPGLQPLWSDGSAIPGPFLAVQRLVQEGANLEVVPLGQLPWPTKLQSNVTSLALLLRKD
jgi:predicted O-methyltransferase YrrM